MQCLRLSIASAHCLPKAHESALFQDNPSRQKKQLQQSADKEQHGCKMTERQQMAFLLASTQPPSDDDSDESSGDHDDEAPMQVRLLDKTHCLVPSCDQQCCPPDLLAC